MASDSPLSEILLRVGLPHHPEDGREDQLRAALSFSNELAMLIADGLRPHFAGIKPDPDGGGRESVSRSAKGYKKLDVNYSTPELGLGLGISLKTVNSVDPKTNRYDHNFSRIDNELVTEAMDYHKRQPYAVLVAVLFLPVGACQTGAKRKQFQGDWVSDFARSVAYYRSRANREDHTGDPDRFERFFVALYDDRDGPSFGEVRFFDVSNDVPKAREPDRGTGLSLDEFLAEVTGTYDARNNPRTTWLE